jgi:hypothetical protein
MSEELRPRISYQEIAFLLELLKQAEANVKHECLSLSEEIKRLEITVQALRARSIDSDEIVPKHQNLDTYTLKFGFSLI